jgi:hypothetical protein
MAGGKASMTYMNGCDRLSGAASGHHTARGASSLLLAVAVLVAACGGSSTTAARTTTTNSAPQQARTQLSVNTGNAPWPTPDHTPDRVAAAGLPHSATEYLTVHYHAHLDIFVNGGSQPVAPSIGRVDQSFFSPLHTHATSGLIHIEAASDQRFTLAMLFTEWGVRLTDDCVGGYCRPATTINAYVDGNADSEPLPTIMLKKGEEIALVIGSPPARVPSNWDCLANIAPIENPAQCADFGQ